MGCGGEATHVWPDLHQDLFGRPEAYPGYGVHPAQRLLKRAQSPGHLLVHPADLFVQKVQVT